MKTIILTLTATVFAISLAAKMPETPETPEFVPCPAGEIEMELSRGTVVWAASNLSGYKTFARNAHDDGCLFQYGHNRALPGAKAPGTVELEWAEVHPIAEWINWNPCPDGWRFPTDYEIHDMIGGMRHHGGVIWEEPRTDKDFYFTKTSWIGGTGPNTGLSVVPYDGKDAGKTLWFPNTGHRSFLDTGRSNGYGTEGYYWCGFFIPPPLPREYENQKDVVYHNDPGDLAYTLKGKDDGSGNGSVVHMQAEHNMFACAVRCVRGEIFEELFFE